MGWGTDEEGGAGGGEGLTVRILSRAGDWGRGVSGVVVAPAGGAVEGVACTVLEGEAGNKWGRPGNVAPYQLLSTPSEWSGK